MGLLPVNRQVWQCTDNCCHCIVRENCQAIVRCILFVWDSLHIFKSSDN